MAAAEWGTMCFIEGVLMSLVMLLTVNVQASVADCPDDIFQNTDTGKATTVVNWQANDTTCDLLSGSRSSLVAPQSQKMPELLHVASSEASRNCHAATPQVEVADPTSGVADASLFIHFRNLSEGTRPPWSTSSGCPGITCHIITNYTQFSIGSTNITCTDENGNDTCIFTVTVNDNEAPVFTKCPSAHIRWTIRDFDPLLPAVSAQVTWGLTSASDNSGGEVTLNSTHEPGDKFELGVTSVTYTARDESGNRNSSCTFNVQVVVQPPADYIFIDNPRTSSSVSCMTVVWPASKDGENKEYALYYWRKGTPKPDSSERIVVTPQQGDITYTFNRQEICSLFPGDLYVVEVSEESGDAISSVEHWTRPRTPRWISVVSGTSSSTSVELTWERVSLQNLEQYRVYLNMYTGYRPTSTIDLGYVSKTTDRLVVDSLRPGAAFDACVSAVVGSGDMRLESRPQSRYINLGSLRESELLAYNFTESTIAVAWRTASGTKNQNDPYMLHIDPDDADENYLAVFNPSGSLAFSEFVGLKPNTEYKINLVSNLGLILGTSQKTRPGRVANVRPMLVTDDAINLEWDAPTEGDIDSYELHISPGENSEPIKAWGTSCYFSSLTAKTEYFFKIFSVYDGMKSVPQTIMVTGGVTKAHASTPVNVVATAVGTVLSFPSIVLTIGIVILCLKYRRLKNSNDSRATVAVSFNPKEDLTDDYQDSRHYQARIKETEGVDYAVPDVDGSSHMTLDPS